MIWGATIQLMPIIWGLFSPEGHYHIDTNNFGDIVFRWLLSHWQQSIEGLFNSGSSNLTNANDLRGYSPLRATTPLKPMIWRAILPWGATIQLIIIIWGLFSPKGHYPIDTNNLGDIIFRGSLSHWHQSFEGLFTSEGSKLTDANDLRGYSPLGATTPLTPMIGGAILS